MKYIKLITITAVLSLALLFGFHNNAAHAFDVNNPTGSNPTNICASGSTQTYCTETANGGTNKISGSDGYIIVTANIMALAGGVAAVIIIIVGSIMFITSGGEPNSVKSARNMVIYSLVGIVIIAMAELIVRFIVGKVTS